MTINELKQYRSLKLEIKELSEEIHKLESADIVQGSDSEFPYIKHNFHVIGIEESALKRRELLHNQIVLKAQTKRIEDYIDDIDDSELRLIFTYRYIRGLSWRQIANRLNVCGDGSTERKKHNRYLKVSRNSRKQSL